VCVCARACRCVCVCVCVCASVCACVCVCVCVCVCGLQVCLSVYVVPCVSSHVNTERNAMRAELSRCGTHAATKGVQMLTLRREVSHIHSCTQGACDGAQRTLCLLLRTVLMVPNGSCEHFCQLGFRGAVHVNHARRHLRHGGRFPLLSGGEPRQSVVGSALVVDLVGWLTSERRRRTYVRRTSLTHRPTAVARECMGQRYTSAGVCWRCSTACSGHTRTTRPCPRQGLGGEALLPTAAVATQN
jgi:hypothetical protein